MSVLKDIIAPVPLEAVPDMAPLPDAVLPDIVLPDVVLPDDGLLPDVAAVEPESLPCRGTGVPSDGLQAVAWEAQAKGKKSAKTLRDMKKAVPAELTLAEVQDPPPRLPPH
jgi:hypothetical protein